MSLAARAHIIFIHAIFQYRGSYLKKKKEIKSEEEKEDRWEKEKKNEECE